MLHLTLISEQVESKLPCLTTLWCACSLPAALLKTMGEQGKWALAEQVFNELEREQLALMQREAELEAAGPMAGLAHASYPASSASSSVSSSAVAAFPGMQRGQAAAAAEASSSSDAIAAVSAAVAALAAARRGAALAMADSPLSCASSMSAGAAARPGLLPADETESVQESRDAAGVVTQSLGQVLDAELDATSVASEAASPSTTAAAAAFSPFSYFGGIASVAAEPLGLQPAGGAWTTENAALQGLQLQLSLDWTAAAGLQPSASSPAAAGLPAGLQQEQQQQQLAAQQQSSVVPAGVAPLRLKPLAKGKGPVNEVVCGALMLAYERGNKWEDAVAVLDRARALGIQPNTIMYNTALSSLGKAGKSDAAKSLFNEMQHPGGSAGQCAGWYGAAEGVLGQGNSECRRRGKVDHRNVLLQGCRSLCRSGCSLLC
jgi:pentatricopeptide repeat protein